MPRWSSSICTPRLEEGQLKAYSLPDSIPARVYTKGTATEAVRLAREIVQYVDQYPG